MDNILRAFIIVLSIFVFSGVIYMLIKRRLNEPNSILWFLIAFVILISGIFPQIVNSAAAFVGIAYQPALVFLVAIIVLLLIVLYSSMEISRLRTEVNEIAITVSILKAELKEKENIKSK